MFTGKSSSHPCDSYHCDSCSRGISGTSFPYRLRFVGNCDNFAIYMFYPKKVKGMGIGVFVLTLLASIIEAAAFLDMIPVYFYNGTRGKQMKYFFYIFYPAHLFLLAMIARAMGLWA